MEIVRLMIVFSCTIILLGIWEFLKWAWFTPKRLEKTLKAQGFRGHPYTFLFGDFKKSIVNEEEEDAKPMNLYDDDFTTRLMGVFGERIREYGKYSYVWSGPTPIVTLTDLELVKEVILKNYHFPKAPHNPLSKLLMKGIQGLEGEKWSKHRKIISPAFHVEKIKLMIPTFYKTINEIITNWEEIVMTSSNGIKEIDVWPYLQRLTSDVISRTAFGSNYEEGKAIFELQKEQSQYFIKLVMSVYIPGWRFVPTKMNRRMKEISNMVNEKIRCIVEGRMKAGEGFGDDFLGLLLESNLNEINEGGSKEFGLSIEDVIEECKVLYFAGQETTSVLLVWTMILLARHPEWQNRAREEVLQLFSDQQIPDYTSLNHLKIVTMILNEVLRLYSPVTGMRRITIEEEEEEAKLGDFTLPTGVILQVPSILIHRDPKVWGDDANEFKPERFSKGVANAIRRHDHNDNNEQQQQQLLSFLPFSWGPRVCMGQNFAMTEARMAITMILRRFSIEVSPSYAHHPHQTSLTLQPKYGAQLILHKL